MRTISDINSITHKIIEHNNKIKRLKSQLSNIKEEHYQKVLEEIRYEGNSLSSDEVGSLHKHMKYHEDSGARDVFVGFGYFEEPLMYEDLLTDDYTMAVIRGDVKYTESEMKASKENIEKMIESLESTVEKWTNDLKLLLSEI